MRSIIAVLLLPALLFTGCKSKEQKQFEADVLAAPHLELDPTDHYELSPWWSNGKQMLRLDDNAGYALFSGMNRYSRPAERGRWAQQSYAMLWLEPYNTPKPDARRVTIGRTDGRLTLHVPKLELMFAIDKPPAVLEDRLIGRWEGPAGTLNLDADLRYTFAFVPQRVDLRREDGEVDLSDIRIVQRGVWSVVQVGGLVLQPDQSPDAPLRLPLDIDEKRIVIKAPKGALMRVQPSATQAQSPP